MGLPRMTRGVAWNWILCRQIVAEVLDKVSKCLYVDWGCAAAEWDGGGDGKIGYT